MPCHEGGYLMAFTRTQRTVDINEVIKPVFGLPTGKGGESCHGLFQGRIAAFTKNGSNNHLG
jgi:hypothetical protein